MTELYEIESAMRQKFPNLDANQRTALLIKYVQEVCGRQSSCKYTEGDGITWVVELTLAPEVAKAAAIDEETIREMVASSLGAEDYNVGVRVLNGPQQPRDAAHA